MRLLDLLKKSSDYLENHAIEDAFADAETMVFHAAGMDRLDAYINNPEVSSSVSAKIRRLLQRRIKGEPVQYIIGNVEFLALNIEVGKGVLIPRPETELLVQEAIQTVTGNESLVTSRRKNSSLIISQSSLSILDLCTGSGCIAIAFAKKFPEAYVCATDISKQAISYAKKNAKGNDTPNICFLQGSLFEPVKGRTFDIIIANPPYIKRQEIITLQREIKDWEPVEALDGGEDGMDFYRAIVSSAGKYMNPGGFIFLELGYYQAEEVKSLAVEEGFKDVSVINDYAGIGRILKAKSPS